MPRYIGCIAGVVIALAAGSMQAQVGPTSAGLYEFAEWSIDNPSWSGNAFDVEAEATFTHTGSGQMVDVDMFYDRNDDWRFRFTGMQTGTWNYTTSSSDPELNGLSGSINITPNANAYGFTTNIGNKWARQKDGGVEAFVPHFRMGFEKSGFNWSSSEIDGYLDDWMGDEGFNGVHVFVAGYWTDRDAGGAKFYNRDPDPRSFDVLEDMISQVHGGGGVTHIWYCGDSQRSQSAESAFGTPGAATTGEQRLLEYIGDRLSPVPGWVMGYGYDNPEHVNTNQLRGWGNYLRDHMAYDHLLGARDQGGNINYTFWPEADFYSRGHWFSGASYSDLADAFDSNTDKPHSFDERWYIGRLGSEADIRQQLWLANMAGGVSTILGNDGHWEKDPYDHPEYFKTAFTFWADRFKADMVRDNALTGGVGAKQYALRSDDGNLVVIYGEGTDDIDVNLSHLAGDPDWADGARIVAVNTRQGYAEVDLGTFSLTDQVVAPGVSSDWALAIRPGSGSPPPQPDPGPRMQVRAVDNGGAAALDGYKTQDVVIDFDGQWTGCQLLIQLDTGDVYQDGVGTAQPPQEAFFATFASLEFDTFVAAGGTTNGTSETFSLGGGAVDLGGAGAAQFDTDGINQAWNPPGGAVIIDGTDFVVARVSLSEDSTGTWMFLASADGVIATYEGPISGGEMVPEPATMSLVSLLGLGVLIRRRRMAGSR